MYSILLTTYECNGFGPYFTLHNLRKIIAQTYRPIQVVVSDHSQNDDIEEMINSLDPSGVEIVYTRYTEHYGNPVANWNNALRFAKGDYITYFCMDDYFYDNDSVARIMSEIQAHPDAKWFATSMFTAPTQVRVPRYNPSILFRNTLGGPSGIIIRRELSSVQLDPQFLWFLDTDWYYRLWEEAGEPFIIPTPTLVVREHPNQLTNTVCNDAYIEEDRARMLAKYPFITSIEFSYHFLCNTPSDIHEHLPTLFAYGSQCSHITECGVRGVVSSYAYANSLRGKPATSLVLVDVESSPSILPFLNKCEQEGIQARFYCESDLTCPMEQTDLLFIDTWHVYGQLKRELERWHTYVNKYILLHDTTVDEWEGEAIRCNQNADEMSQITGIPVEEITKGLWPAVEEFLHTHPEWKLKERFTNNNGLTVLERASS